MTGPIVLIYLANAFMLAAILGLIPAAIAYRKDLSFFKWWLAGFLLWIVAMPAAILAEPNVATLDERLLKTGDFKKCPFCAEVVKEEASACRYCGRDLPMDPLTYYNRGHAHAELGNLDQAISDFSEAIALDPKLADAYYERGDAYDEQGNFAKAIADYTQAIALDPKDPDAYNDRGCVYYKQGDCGHAIADYERAIQCGPDFPYPYYNRAIAYKKLGQMEKAAADLQRARQLPMDEQDRRECEADWAKLTST